MHKEDSPWVILLIYWEMGPKEYMIRQAKIMIGTFMSLEG